MNGLVAQLYHVESELKELKTEVFGSPDVLTVAEEAVDLLHSVETLLIILQEKHEVDVAEVMSQVEGKNRVRGYYE